MQLSSIPKNVMAANQQVAGHLTTAHQLTAKAQGAVESGSKVGSVRDELSAALEAATQAREGVQALGKGNLLDGTFQRYSGHAVRELGDAVAMLDRKGPLSADGLKLFTEKLFDAEVSTRLGSEAGKRSLARPALRDIERASSFGTGGSSSSSDSGPVWVDGQWLDSLGNPARGGGDSWTGPDGQSFDSMGNPVDGGRYGGGDSYVGPDGVGYSGI